MAYYPAQDTVVVSAKTEPEMKAAVAAKMAEGYFPVDDNSVWNAKLVSPTVAYRQAMVKRQNTDPEFIAAMYTAFQTILEGIESQLATANTYLQSIVTNTNRIPTAAASTTAVSTAPTSTPVATQSQETK